MDNPTLKSALDNEAQGAALTGDELFALMRDAVSKTTIGKPTGRVAFTESGAALVGFESEGFSVNDFRFFQVCTPFHIHILIDVLDRQDAEIKRLSALMEGIGGEGVIETALHMVNNLREEQGDPGRLRLDTVMCCHCGHPSASIEEAAAHDAVCEKHPAVIRVRELEERLAKMQQASDPCDDCWTMKAVARTLGFKSFENFFREVIPAIESMKAQAEERLAAKNTGPRELRGAIVKCKKCGKVWSDIAGHWRYGTSSTGAECILLDIACENGGQCESCGVCLDPAAMYDL